MPDLPEGTVTLLFTDIDGSTRLLQELGRDRYIRALSDQRRIVREAFTRNGGVEVEMQGDSFHFAFAEAQGAVAAAAEAQKALAEHEWESEPIRIRIGMHTGEPVSHEGLYAGLDVHRAARIMSAGHGGQVLLSEQTAALVGGDGVRELGRFRLKDFDEPIPLYQLGEAVFPPLKTLANTNLPNPVSSFLGRETELQEADALLDETRLLTVTGTGGAGKTRFSVELARRVLDGRFADYPDGIFFVALAPLREPELLPATIAITLGLKDVPGQSVQESLAEHLADKRILLLLDNVEQLLAASPMLADLLAQAAGVTLLVTSREPMRVSGEHEYMLPPLAEADAACLFLDRARKVNPLVEDGSVVAELCRRLEGLPLAIELAAARANLLSPVELLERLSTRLDLLKGGRDAEARHATLRTTIDWSFELLPEPEQALFRRLAVFRGGWGLDAAGGVADADLDALASLLDKNLIRRTSDGRFWMLETIREYALERLQAAGEVGEMCRRHAEYFAAKRPSPEKVRKSDSEAMAQIEADHDNFRAAFDWALDHGRVELAQDIHESLWFYWITRGLLHEGAERGRRVIAKTTGDSVRDAFTLMLGSESPRLLGELDEALAAKERARPLLEQHNERRALAALLTNLGEIWQDLGDTDRARLLIEEGLALRKEIGLPHGIAHAESTLADLEIRLGNYGRALALIEACVEVWRTEESWSDVAESLVSISQLRRRIGQLDRSADALKEGIALADRLGDVHVLSEAIEQAASLLWIRDSASRAVSFWSAAVTARASSGLKPWDAEEHELLVEDVRRHLASAEFEAAWEEGAGWSLEEATKRALEAIGDA